MPTRQICRRAAVVWLCGVMLATEALGADWGTVGLTIGNEAALTPANRTELWRLVTTVPRPLWASLEQITLDGQGFDPAAPSAINCVSGADGWTEDPFPADLPGPHIRPTGFWSICSHELTHHLPVTAARHRPWLNEWATRLIAEAGCEPAHYLRSGAPPCFFRDAPQEFVASMGNQWLADSAGVWRLAAARWAQGNPHPANQAALMTAWFGATPPGSSTEWATVAAFRWTPDGVRLTPWQVSPWRCGGDVRLVGEDVLVRLTLDTGCRVTALAVDE
ncbi:MAG: hypothetical protein HYY11_02980 [Candidatus Methylomirabilis oxyfera]|nr:hypothetical protein [Candidatus Methylomirabilis oxyfera]